MKKMFFAHVRTGIAMSVAILLLAFTQSDSFFERMYSSLRHHLHQQANQAQVATAMSFNPGATCTGLAVDAIGGNVWEDFNYDGDKGTEDNVYGVAGIQVVLYNSANQEVATQSTDSDGNYLFSNLLETNYRVEFVIPDDMKAFTKATVNGVNSQTSVQFVAAGNCADLGVANPGQYCDNNPFLITPCFVSGEPSLGGSAGIGDVLVSYPHAGGATKADVNMLALNRDMGSTWGIAYAKTSQDIFAAAMMKRHAGFGPLGIGGIYKVNHADPSNPVLENWLDLSAAGVNIGNNPRTYQLPAGSAESSTDPAGFDAVGKIGLGDLDISEDEKTLYVINLNNNGSLVEIDIATKTVTKTTPIANPGATTPSDVRPWGLSVHKGNVYIGSVASGQIGGGASMRFFIQKYDGTSFTTVLNESLNYEKGFVHLGYNKPNAPEICKNWETWTANFNDIHTAGSSSEGPRWCRPQPILSDIEFDYNGDMIVAFMDRTGHQTGYLQANTDENNLILGNGYIGGEMLRAASSNGIYVLENGGTTVNGGGAGLNNLPNAVNGDTVLQGPGGGEYYSGDLFLNIHQETSLGGMVLSPNGNTVALNVMDPTDYYTGGTMWLNNTTGKSDRVFELYSSNNLINPNNNVGTFGKAAGLGDLELSCAPAPIEIGNFIWDDANSDGIQNPSEVGLDGITVELIKNGVKIATTTTANGGQYYFSADGIANQIWETTGDKVLPNMEYCIRVALSDSGLNSSIPTLANSDSSTNGDARDSDATTVDGYAKITFTTGGAGETNHDLDFGFTSNLCIGDYVWLDKNVDGIQDDTESGIAGLTVELLKNNTVVASTATDNNGQYFFTIDGATGQNWVTTGDKVLPNMDYTVRIALDQTNLAKHKLTGQNQTDDEKDSDASLDGNHAIISLTSGAPGSFEHQYDFGFRPTLCVGDLVWTDANNDGLFNNGESGLDGVEVILFNVGTDGQKGTDDDTQVATQTTTNGGKYLFSDLDEGTYFIKLNSGIPAGYASSTGNGTAFGDTPTFEPGATIANDQNDDDNGSQMGPMIMSEAFTLEYCKEPTDDGDDDSNTNLTVDFGIIHCLSIGDFVWLDKNVNGIQDDTETGIDGITVELLKNNTVVASTTTQNGGQYFFTADGVNNQNWVTTGDKVLPNMDYTIRIALDQVQLNKHKLTAANATEDTKDSDGEIDGDYAIINLTAGIAGSADYQYDFGFRPTLCVGNLVWTDANNDGLFNNSETGLDGVEVILFNVGTDGQKGTDDDTQVATQTTANGGKYLFSDLNEGTYFIKLNSGIPAGYASSTGNGTAFGDTPTFEPGATIANDQNDDDNGSQMGPMIMSEAFTLEYCKEPTDDGDDDSNTNLTVDFGIIHCLSIGDFVWLDKNVNGIQDDTETGIDGITVELLKNNTVVASTTTQNGGRYFFTADGINNQNWVTTGDKVLPNMDYTIRIALDQVQLNKHKLTAANATEDTKDSDGEIAGDYAIINFTAGIAGSADYQYDFGFRPTLCVGNLVWLDSNNNGTVDNGEDGIPDVEVVLFKVGGDGTKGVGNDVEIGRQETDADGKYLFTDLEEGIYFIKINDGIPTNLASANGTGVDGSNPSTYEPGVAASTDIDNDDNGSQMGTMVMTDTFGLKYCTEPTTDGDDDSNTNLSIDIALTPCLSVGNVVFHDLNNDGIFDDRTESTIEGVEVQLYTAGADGQKSEDDILVVTSTTLADGLYLFDGLKPGDYYVKLNSGIPANMVSSTGEGLTNVTGQGPFEPAPNNNADNNDNGSQMGNMIMSDLFNLSIGGESTTDGDNDPNTDLTVDFGLIELMSLGNLVWKDVNNDGVFDKTEKGVAGVEMILFQLGPDGQKATADDVEIKRDTTDANGHYLFTHLNPGDYYIKLADGIPLGCGSSTGEGIMDVDGIGAYEQAPSPNTNINNDDNGNQMDYMIMSDIVSLELNNEPINDGDKSDQSNLSVDFGLFQLLRLGNLVWEDYNNNGQHESDEPGIEGVETILYQVGPDGIKGNEDDVEIDRMTTDSTGHYIFVRLLPGEYYVKLNSGIDAFSSSTGEGIDQVTGNGIFEKAPDPDNDVDDEDNGTQMGAMVMSDLIMLEFMNEPAFEDNFVNSNFTLDFGLFQPLAIGNLVWNDLNNNGQVDTNEPGIAGVSVQLFNIGPDGQKSDDDILVDQMTTNVNGGYNFKGLKPGAYYIKLSNFPTNFISSNGSGLEQLSGTGPYEPAPATNNDINADDNGSQMGAMIMSDIVTLQLYSEPINDGDTDRKTNLAVDFGLLKVNQIKIHNPCTCLNNESGPNAGDGQFTERIVILSNTSGQTWAVMAAEGAYNDANGLVVPGAVATEIGQEDGQYAYAFDVRHVDGQGYSIKFSNGSDNLTAGNVCHYEKSCHYTAPPVCDDCTPGPPQADPCLMTFIIGADDVARVDSLNCCDEKSTFVDDGTNDGLYEDTLGMARNDIFTICPQNQWQTLNYTFSEFDVAAGDTLYVYDGRTVSDSLLGKFSGPGISATGGWVASSCSPGKNQSSCLTFQFVTNGDNRKGTGWNGNFTCSERNIELKVPNITSPKLECQQTTSMVTIVPATMESDCGAVLDTQRVVIRDGKGRVCKDTCLAPDEMFEELFAIGQYQVTYSIKSDSIKTAQTIFGVQAASHVCNDLVRIPIGSGCSLQIYPDDLLEGPCDTIPDTAYYHITISGIDKNGKEQIIATGGGKGGNYPVVTKEQFEEFGGQLSAEIERRFFEDLTFVGVCNSGPQSLKCTTLIEVADYTGPVFQTSTRDTFKVCDIDLTEEGLSFLTKPKVADNCSSPEVKFEGVNVLTDGGICDTTRIDVIYSATDESGNTSTVTKNVVLVRAEQADMLLPNNVTLSCGEDSESTFDDLEKVGVPSIQIGRVKNGVLIPSDTIPLSTEKYICGYILQQNDRKVNAGHCGTKLFRQWDLLDWCAVDTDGPIALQSQFINLKDTLAPTFVVEVDTLPFTNLDLDHFSCTYDVTKLAKPAATDLCSDVAVKMDQVWRIENNQLWPIASGQWTALDCDSFRVRWVAEDACHEQLAGDTLSQDLLIRDVTKPAVVCTDKITVSIGSEEIKMFNTAFDAGSFDACGIKTLEVSRDQESWDEFVVFDCQDIHNDVKVYLRATDKKGNQNTCWMTVDVEDKLAPICSDLPDMTGTCDEQHAEEFGPTTDTNGDSKMSDEEWVTMSEELVSYYNINYGEPKCSDNAGACGALVMEQQYQLITWPCGMLEIKRRYRAIDWMGEGNVSDWAEQNIKIEYKANWSITFPTDWSGTCGDAIPDSRPFVTNGTCDLLAMEMNEQTFVTNEDACLKMVRTFTIINWCNYQVGDEGVKITRDENEHGLVLYPNIMTSKGNEKVGKIIYTQVLKLRDNEAPVVTIQEPETCINGVDGDAAPYGVEDLTPGATPFECDELKTWSATAEDCSGAENITWKARIYENGTLVKEEMANTISYIVQNKNRYKAEFWAYDGCGNSAGAETADKEFWDCKKPTPYCLHGLATELMQTGMVQIWAKDLDRGSYDNCTPSNKLEVRIHHSSLGSAPTTLDGVQALPEQVTLNCVYLGSQTVSLYVIDEEGNWDFCETYVIIQDNMGACEGLEPQAGLARIEGTIMDWRGNTVEEVMVRSSNSNEMMTHENGTYNFDLAMNESYTITPEKDVQPLNGVSTFDLVLISKHILGSAKFTNPYQYIAADVNQSGSVTAFDMVQVRRLILNLQTEFTNNTSWKFVASTYEFTAENPAAEAYPTVSTVANLDHNMQMDFTAVKIGDINGNARTNSLQAAESRSTNGTFTINVEDQAVKAGQTYTVAFTTNQLAVIEGYQFTLDMGNLQFEQLKNGVTSIDNFGLNKIEKGYITTSWNGDSEQWAVGSGQLAIGSKQLFTIEFTATDDGRLSEQLSIIERPTAVEAYHTDGELLNVELSFNNKRALTKSFELYQNQPNPFKSETTISFFLPESSKVVLTLRDEMGRLLKEIKADKAAGVNTIQLTDLDLPRGLIYYQISTEFGTQTKKMLNIE